MERKYLPYRPGLLRREHVVDALTKGLDYPLITLIAGPGYGKTAAASQFAKEVPHRMAWINLTPLDNDRNQFWHKMAAAYQYEYPKLASFLLERGFPKEGHEFDGYFDPLAKELALGRENILVLDNFSVLGEGPVRALLEATISMQFAGLCILLISTSASDQERIRSLVGRDCLEINTDMLRFTRSEAELLFRTMKVGIKSADLDEILRQTEGWPMALYLMGQLLAGRQDTPLSAMENIRLPQLDQLFESGFYWKYPPDFRHMLVCFSFLPSFSLEMARGLHPDCAATFLKAIRENVFISYDYNGETFSFHPMYQSFLQQNRYTVSDAQLEGTFQIAGDWFVAHGGFFEAIACYSQCACYIEMSEAIRVLLLSNPSDIPAAFLLRYLQSLPDAFLSDHPEIRFTIALLYVSQLELGRAKDLLLEIEGELETSAPDEDRLHLLGEVYAMLADVAVMRNDSACFAYYPKAAALLGEGSNYHRKAVMYAGNNNLLFLPGTRPGLLEETVENVMTAAKYTARYMNGQAYGFEYLFAAEAAYAVGDTAAACENCHRAMFRAIKEEQYDIICNGHFYQLRCDLYNGNYGGVRQNLSSIQEHCEKHNADKLVEIYDTAKGWLCLRLGMLDKVPRWIEEYDESRYARLPVAIGRNKIVHAHFLTVTRRYRECIAYLDELEDVYRESALWTIRLHHYILKAMCLLETGASEEAMNCLYRAYEMTYANDIVMYFAEYSGGITALLQFAAEEKESRFPREWLNGILEKAAIFSRGIAAVKREYGKEKTEPPFMANLSRREREILVLLVNGKTRNEIARELGISVNSVKTHIGGAYSKLGAANKADAVRLAIGMGII